MTIYLRKATASQECALGQMLSSTDGLTAYTTQIEVTDIHLWKAGATTLAHSSGVSAHISNGVHYITLDATDTDTAGSLLIFVQPTGSLPLRVDCIVLNASVYDAWFSTGVLPVDVTTIHGSALTETAGQLAAGFTKFFDVAAPASTMELITAVTTCTTNTDMRGTDSAALATELAKVPKSDSAVTWNATALASIQTEANDALIANNLDHLLLTPVAEDMTDQCADGSIMGRFLTGGDTSDFISTDSIIDIHAAIVALAADVGDAGLDSVVSKLDDILADTGELQTDWVNGGRLDLLLDGAASAGDPWSTALPGAYGAGTAGLLIGTTLPTAIADLPTNTEFEARTLPSADYVVVDDTLARVTLVDTCTTNTDMRGTNSAALASVCTEPRLAQLDEAGIPTDIDNVYDDVGDVKTVVDAVLVDTGTTLDTLIKRALGLVEENCKMTSATYSVTGKQTDATWKIYPTAEDCTADTNVLATYTMSATYDVDDNLATYKVIKS